MQFSLEAGLTPVHRTVSKAEPTVLLVLSTHVTDRLMAEAPLLQAAVQSKFGVYGPVIHAYVIQTTAEHEVLSGVFVSVQFISSPVELSSPRQ